MNEKFLHFIWQNQLFDKKQLYSTDGKKIEIIHPGFLNNDQGADFFNAKIIIDNVLWAGNVEIHIKSSDWYLHNHHKDKKYNNVILQVVLEDDKPAFAENGQKINTLVLNVDKKYYDNYQKLILNNSPIACQKFIPKIPKIYINNWLERAEIERLELKTNDILNTLKKFQNDWNQTFFIYLSKNFGFKKNDIGFELLAKSLNFKYLEKHKDNLLQIEALLFGQAGFLSENCNDEYFLKLQQEYNFLRHKFNLKPLNPKIWNFLRLRPANFPTIRISQLANLLFKNEFLLSKILDSEANEIPKFFDVKASDYWDNHYKFCKKSKTKSPKKLGKSSIQNILINTVANFLFAYGYYFTTEKFKSKAIKLLENLQAEKNSIINKWEKIQLKPKNAFESQALIHTFNNYCKKGKCLECGIGKNIIMKL